MEETRQRGSTPCEFVVRSDGHLELQDPESADRWLTTDQPVEIVR